MEKQVVETKDAKDQDKDKAPATLDKKPAAVDIKVIEPSPRKKPASSQGDEEEEVQPKDYSMLSASHNLHTSMELPMGSRCESGWFELKAKGKLPDKRSYHSAVIYDGNLYAYGGEDIKEGKYNDFWKLNLDEFIGCEEHDLDDQEIEDVERDGKLQWRLVQTNGDSPGPLAHHKACVHNQCIYIFGGIDNHGESNPHFYSLDMNTFKWTKEESQGEMPPARDDHSLSLDCDDLYVFGGFVEGRRQNDLYVYNFDSKKWTCLFENKPYYDIEPSKEFPCPRSGQACAAYEGKVYVFGGRNDYNDMLGDTWEFDTKTKKWEEMGGDNHPIGRSSHTLTVENNRMILFGGIVDITKEINELHQFDFMKKEWNGIDDDVAHRDGIERSPSPRKTGRGDYEFNAISKLEETNNMTMTSNKKRSPNKSGRDRNFFLPKEIPKQKKGKGNLKKKRDQYD